MLRKLTSIAAVLLCVAGFGLATTASAQASGVLPVHGNYSGTDHAGRIITFSFSGNQMSHFKVGHQPIGGAHVGSGAWHETCHNGYCTKGQWQTDFHVVGHWRTPGGHWTAFSASTTPPQYRGDYQGTDHGGATVRFTYNGTHVHGFRINGHGDFPTVQVSHGAWHEVCSGSGWCYRGRFQGTHTIVGEWRTHGSTWHAWEAYAIAY